MNLHIPGLISEIGGVTNGLDNEPYVSTVSSRPWYFLNPRAEDVDWSDIVWGLSRQARFNGQTKTEKIYSVAQHLCHCFDRVPDTLSDARPYVFLHDIHEAYLGDIVGPVKNWLAQSAPIDDLERRTDEAIWTAAGLPFPSDETLEIVRMVDRRMLATEWVSFRDDHPSDHGIMDEPYQLSLTAWDGRKTRFEFGERLHLVLSGGV